MQFEWDENKNRQNKKKHGVPFEEAQTVFFDPNARFIPDPLHSDEEERFIILGISSNIRLLVVCHCYRTNNEIIRLISERKATKNEIKLYDRRL